MNNDDYAIVIGVRYPRLAPLTATLRDAVRFSEWLRNPAGGGLPDANIKHVISAESQPQGAPGPRPIRAQVDEALAQILSGERKEIDGQQLIGRRLYFYFSGHGFGTRYFDVAMLMADAHMDALGNNIGLQHYLDLFQTTNLFREVVAIIDCCRDPSPPRKNVTLAAPSLTFETPEVAPEVDNLIVLAAGQGRKSYEITPKATGVRTGILTAAVLTCLTDITLADAEGHFTTATLREHLPGQVSKLAKELRAKKLAQRPSFIEIASNKIVFATVPVASLDHGCVRIVAPKGLTGDLTLSDGTGTRIDARKAADVTEDQPPWCVKLFRNQVYSVLHTGGPNGPRVQLIDPSALKRSNDVFTVAGG